MPRQAAFNGADTRPELCSFPPVLTPPMVAEYYGIGVETVRDMISAGTLPAVRPGRLMLVPRASLEAYERRQGELAAERAAEVR